MTDEVTANMAADAADSSPSKIDALKGKIAAFPFSLSAFLQGISGIILVLAILCAWVFIRQDSATDLHQQKLASKTVLIEKPQDNIRQRQENTIAAKEEGLEKVALISAPIQELIEQGEYGLMPIVNPDNNLTPFHAYKKEFAPEFGKSQISIVIQNAGVSKSLTQQIIDTLPANISLSFSPYANDINTLVQLARTSGHEPWLDLPLQSLDFGDDDPGSQSILRNASIEQNAGRIAWILSQATGYVGFLAPEDHVFKSDVTDINIVLEQVFKRGLALVEINPLGSTEIGLMATQYEAPYFTADIYLGNATNSRDIMMQLKKLQDMALKYGRAVGVIKPTPLTLKILSAWIKNLDDQALELAPLSSMIK